MIQTITYDDTLYQLVPKEPTQEQWGELARDIMMWMRFSQPTPAKLFKHLDMLGREIPQWLRDEPEMKHLDHVVSKGTCCVIVYRAMLASAPAQPAERMPLTMEQIKAVAICLESRRVSVSEVQRKIGISWLAANELCQSIVDAGLVNGLELAPQLLANGIKGES